MTPIDLSQFEGMTPGPWEVRQNYYIGRPGKFSLAEVKCGDIPAEDTEQHKANARAIASVPDLIAEVKRLRECLGKWSDIVQGGDSLQRLEGWAREFVTEARAAITPGANNDDIKPFEVWPKP